MSRLSSNFTLPLNIGPRWDDWVIRLNEYFDAAAIDDDKQRLASLFFFGGTKLRKIHSTLPEAIPEGEEEANEGEFDKAVYRLNKFFNPKKNAVIEVYKFRQSKQDVNETIEQFVTRLRLLAQYCEYDDDKEIVGQVIQSCSSMQFRKKLLRTPKLDINI